ncbi:hypothetical protein [Hymenobacter siberiensis]|uniref:hypothetical protein n=1 Tax=Hymenobacter siberiensis TaxID=2848396 RepID=UPI001C1DD0B5|nr:hypothetical protein [Hymenobacter siberiensis]
MVSPTSNTSESPGYNQALTVVFLQQQLLGACVESFGIYHQVLCIEFRNGHDDIMLSIDSKLLFEPDLTHDARSAEETALLFFYKINLQPITALEYLTDGSLALTFQNGYRFTVQGRCVDSGEPWQLATHTLANGGWLVIGFEGGGLAMFGPTPIDRQLINCGSCKAF